MNASRQPLDSDDAMQLRRLVRAQLHLLEELGSPYGNESEADAGPVIGAPRDVYELLAPEMGPLEHEQLRVLLLDTRHRVLNVVTLYQGTVSKTPARIAELFRDAVRANAPAIVIAHNHPSGVPEPSTDDECLTRKAAKAGELLGIELLDHIVIGRGRFVSLKERGVL
jgi:DNA repair protein RadC